jgi:hypothetical protein
VSPGTATAETATRTRAAPEPGSEPFPAAAAALFAGPGVPDLNALLAGVPPDAATRAIAAVPDFGALVSGPAPPLAPAVQAAVGQAVGADVTGLSLRADPAVDAVLRMAGVEGLVAGRTLLLPSDRVSVETPVAGRLLLEAVQQALSGVAGPVETGGPMPDPTRDQPPPGVGVAPAPPEAPIEIPEVPTPEATPEEGEAAAPEEVPAPEAAPPGEAPPPEGAAEPEAEAPAVPPPPEVELIIPPAPTEPGPAQQARQAKVGGAARSAAGAAKALPSAQETTTAARAAVVEPPEETAARARAALTKELGERPPPSPEIVALCEKIQTAIRKRRPVDEDALRATNPEKTAQEVGQGLNTSLATETTKAKTGYEELGKPPAGSPQLTPQTLTTPPTAVTDPGIDAARATPDPVPPENLSLDADKGAAEQKITDAKIERHSSEPIQTPPFSTVREGKAELDALAQDGPASVAAQQAQTLGQAQQGMAELQTKALVMLQSSRESTVTKVSGGQTAAKGSEQEQRAAASKYAQGVFNQARTDVMDAVTPLPGTAMKRWDAGVAILSTAFKNHLADVKHSVDKRHSGFGGGLVGLLDDWTGLPDWITDEYTKAETAFGDGVCTLLKEISRDVNAVIAAAQARIATARKEIDKTFKELPASLQTWAEGERQKFGAQLDGLGQQVEQARTGFIKDVSGKAIAAVGAVQAEIEKLRQEAKGKLEKIYDAINAFLDDPIKAIIEGLLLILGIPPPAFWALVDRIKQVISDIADDPEGFLNNLVDAVKLGFEQFFENFGKHVIDGFWQWLFQGLTKLGVRIPADFSLGSLVKLALEVMGISWPRIRGVLVKHIGERNVVLIEQAWTLISTLVEKGVDGVLELLKEQLDPAKLIDQIISAAVDFLVETLVKKVALKILAMLNPATAVLQAIELIYDLLVWIFQNAARIFRLVEAVVGGIADIIAGRISGAAAVVEKALAMMIPPVIDFFAELLGLGDLPWQIADIVKKLQAYVLSLVDRVVKFLVDKVKALLGIGDDEKGGADTELGKEVGFSDEEGESHRQWIDPSGTPMMASTTETVDARLKTWKSEAKGKFKDNPDKLEQVRGLIAQAQDKLKEVNGEADTLAAEYKNPKPGAKLPSDDPLEALQVELAGLLTQIFKAFGGDVAAIRKDIAEHLPDRGDLRRNDLVDTWEQRLKEFRIGNEVKDPRLWPDPVLGGIGDRARAVTEKKSEQEQLMTWFTTAPGERSANTADFGDYAFVQMSAPHTVRRDFTVALGSEAGAVFKDTAKANIAEADNVTPDYKTKLLGLVDRIQFTWSATGGTWTLPTERLPDHDRYKPLDIDISDDGRTVKYTTVTKQEFTVTLDPKTGLTSSIVGKSLRLGMALPGQRGKTREAPGQVANRGLDAAHLIADRFGGSGYVAGLNLVATSEEYNRVQMRAVEDEIVDIVEEYAEGLGLDRTQVDFDLQVDIETVKLPNGAVLSAIKKDERFKAGDEFDAEIVQEIVDGEKVPELRRVKSVTYTLRLDGKVKLVRGLKEDVQMLKGG